MKTLFAQFVGWLFWSTQGKNFLVTLSISDGSYKYYWAPGTGKAKAVTLIREAADSMEKQP